MHSQKTGKRAVSLTRQKTDKADGPDSKPNSKPAPGGKVGAGPKDNVPPGKKGGATAAVKKGAGKNMGGANANAGSVANDANDDLDNEAMPTDYDEDAYEDLTPEQRERIREQMRQSIVAEDLLHYEDLAFACLMISLHLMQLVTDFGLAVVYYDWGYKNCSAGIFIVYFIYTLTHIEFDFVNNGRLKFLLLDILQLRVPLEFYYYVKTWELMKGKVWHHARFRSAVGFESFFGALPILAVHCYVLGKRDSPMTDFQVLGFLVTCTFSCQHAIMYFRYLDVPNWIYYTLLCKAVYDTGVRCLVIYLCIVLLDALALVPILLSYLLGWGLYYYMVRQAQQKQFDDPLYFRWAHGVMGHLMASVWLFIAIPFAPCHSQQEWWRGYMLAEAKIQFENITAGMIILMTFGFKTRNASSTFQQMEMSTLWAGMIFLLILAIIDMVSLVYLAYTVPEYMDETDFTNERIMDLWAYNCNHLRRWLCEGDESLTMEVTHAMQITQMSNVRDAWTEEEINDVKRLQALAEGKSGYMEILHGDQVNAVGGSAEDSRGPTPAAFRHTPVRRTPAPRAPSVPGTVEEDGSEGGGDIQMEDV